MLLLSMFPPRFSILCWSLSEPFFTVMAANWSFFSPNSTISSSFNISVFSYILSVELLVFIFSVIYNQSLLSHHFFATVVSDFASGLILSCCASFFFFFLVWWGVIPCFLTKLSYFVFLLQPWNQPLPLGAWFLLLVNGIKDQDLGCWLYSGLLGSFSKPYPFLDSFLLRGLTWSSEVSMNSF